MAALTQAAYRKFGSSIGGWPVKALKSMKQLLAGFDASRLAELAGDVLDQGYELQFIHAILFYPTLSLVNTNLDGI